MYTKPFQITKKISNNAFSFSNRKKQFIEVPSIINGTIDNIQIGNKIAFEDIDEKGCKSAVAENLKSCVGLKNFIRTEHPKTKKPVIIVDNHNHVFYFWYEARYNKQIKNGVTLVHIDQHKDMRKPKRKLVESISDDLKKVFEYTNEVLNVGNYIQPAIEDGLIGEVIMITSELDLKNRKLLTCPSGRRVVNRKSLIVNIDLDFWAPEMDYIDNKLKIDITKKMMEKADLITIATSPFFIDQELAIRILKELLE